ncbi:MAG TPA: hypothetical protein VG820_01135, partial [Fimbriimonadaceae bacterium]|nr:hypothetical protein [Fimbriimonadaceae bacterium]
MKLAIKLLSAVLAIAFAGIALLVVLMFFPLNRTGPLTVHARVELGEAIEAVHRQTGRWPESRAELGSLEPRDLADRYWSLRHVGPAQGGAEAYLVSTDSA